MVMNQFVTTYRKDYLWPYVRTFGAKPASDFAYRPQSQGLQNTCECNAPSPVQASGDQPPPLGPLAVKEQHWSRLGPMGPLLDPKVYPARVGAAPESPISRFNQPNVYLQQLQEKYPFIYECLRTAPPDDMIARINRDRLRTTYQVDFCRMREYPDAPYDELLKAAGVTGGTSCPQPAQLPGDTQRPNQRSIAFRPAIISKMGFCKSKSGSGRSGSIGKDLSVEPCIGTCKGPLASITVGASEYADNISRLGGLIIKDKIHSLKETKKDIPASY